MYETKSFHLSGDPFSAAEKMARGNTYFVSYARSDKTPALKLVQALVEAGVELWVDEMDIVQGDRWDDAIEKALMSCRGIVLCLSPAAVASENVLDEIHFALENDLPLYPVMIERCRVPYRVARIERIDLVDDAFEQGSGPSGAPSGRRASGSRR